jgi:hypothetical protein
VLNSKGGKPYIELDQFVPKSKGNESPAPKKEVVEEEDGLPF